MPASNITTSSVFVLEDKTGIAFAGHLSDKAVLAVDGQVVDLSSLEAAMAKEAPVTVDVRVPRSGLISRMEIHMHRGPSVRR